MVRKIRTGILIVLLGLCGPHIDAHKRKKKEEKEYKELPILTFALAVGTTVVGGFWAYKGIDHFVKKAEAKTQAKEQAKRLAEEKRIAEEKARQEATPPPIDEWEENLQNRVNNLLGTQDNSNETPPPQPPQQQNQSSEIVFLDSRDNTLARDDEDVIDQRLTQTLTELQATQQAPTQQTANNNIQPPRPSLPLLNISQSRTSITRHNTGAAVLSGSEAQDPALVGAVVEEENMSMIPALLRPTHAKNKPKRKKKGAKKNRNIIHPKDMIEKASQDYIDRSEGNVLNAVLQVCRIGELALFIYMCKENQIQPKRHHLKEAIKAGNRPIVKYLIEERRIKLGYKDLKEACKGGCLQVVKYLIDELNIKPFKNTLTEACKGGNLQIVKYLIDEKNLRPDKECIMAAIKVKDIQMLKYINMERKIPMDESCVGLIWRSNDVRMIKYLIDDKMMKPDVTWLQTVTIANSLQLVKYLIEEKNIQPDNYCFRVAKGHPQILEYLRSRRLTRA